MVRLEVDCLKPPTHPQKSIHRHTPEREREREREREEKSLLDKDIMQRMSTSTKGKHSSDVEMNAESFEYGYFL